jgi:hypothetical protein
VESVHKPGIVGVIEGPSGRRACHTFVNIAKKANEVFLILQKFKGLYELLVLGLHSEHSQN